MAFENVSKNRLKYSNKMSEKNLYYIQCDHYDVWCTGFDLNTQCAHPGCTHCASMPDPKFQCAGTVLHSPSW